MTSTLEFEPGMYGTAWDPEEDRPVVSGRVTLWSETREIATGDLASDGTFGFARGPERRLHAGEYWLVIEAPGFLEKRISVAVSDPTESDQLGRIELRRTASH